MKVLIADQYHKSIEQEMTVFSDYGIELETALCRTEDELIMRARGCDALIVSYITISRKVLLALPCIRLIVKYGVGVDNIDLDAARQCGVHVANVPDYCTEEVAVHALALTLASVRYIPVFDRCISRKEWPSATGYNIRRLSTLAVGLIGFGRIARSYYDRIRTMVKSVIAYDPYLSDSDYPQDIEAVHQISDVFEKADIIAMFLPMNADTARIIDSSILEYGKHRILVNTSRGGLLDYEAVATALDNGNLDFLAVDVWNEEPVDMKSDLNRRLLAHDNVLLTPHVAWCSNESEVDLRRKAALTIAEYLVNGQEINFLV